MPTWIITALKKCVFLFVCLRVHRYIMSETAEPRADVDTQRLFVKAHNTTQRVTDTTVISTLFDTHSNGGATWDVTI